MSYKSQNRQVGSLFPELFPYGGKLNEGNKWIRLRNLVPWDELEEIYRKYFSDLGRPGKDSDLINGLIIAKHLKEYSDEEVVEEFYENPYLQYFCGYDNFVTNLEIEASTLSRVRKRLGAKYFRQFEKEILNILKEKKLIRAKGVMVDATVFPANLAFPTDTGLIEKARQWTVKIIKQVAKSVGIKIRTYCRVARATFIKFQRRRQKKTKEISKANKQMLQYLRRNIGQLKELLGEVINFSGFLPDWLKERFILDRLAVVENIYRQQWEMLKKKTHRVKDRIVSLHRPEVRPIVTGKSGKETEFGLKGVVSYVDGYIFLDGCSYDAFNEAKLLPKSLSAYQKRFGKKPGTIILDNLYGNRENRRLLKELGIRASLIPLGRREKLKYRYFDWIKKKQRERNRIEGSIGNGKVNYGLDRLLYKIAGGDEIWVRMGLLGMNLTTALRRA